MEELRAATLPLNNVFYTHKHGTCGWRVACWKVSSFMVSHADYADLPSALHESARSCVVQICVSKEHSPCTECTVFAHRAWMCFSVDARAQML